MTHYAITAIGADRPGIVAAVTGALRREGCNLEDSTMSILRGHFAILLVLDAPTSESSADLEVALAAPARDLGLVITVRPISEEVPVSPEGDMWTLAVYGADKPGIVHEIASLLGDRQVNICDLSTSVIGDPDEPVYAMTMNIAIPPGTDTAALAEDLEAKAGEIGVDCSLHEAQADIL